MLLPEFSIAVIALLVFKIKGYEKVFCVRLKTLALCLYYLQCFRFCQPPMWVTSTQFISPYKNFKQLRNVFSTSTL